MAPRRLLLATDLSARSDRAMDRASMLMRQYDAELVVVHVLEPTEDELAALRLRSSPLPATAHLVELAHRQLSDDLRGAGERVTIRVEDGVPADVLLRIARERSFDLIVTGVARNETLGRFTLGKTVDRLLRASPVPLLAVTDRARAPYRSVLVACDFSDASRRALEATAELFPALALTVFHAYSPPGGIYASETERNRALLHQATSERFTEFLGGVELPAETRARLRVRVEHGEPDRLLRELGLSDAIDLVVLGSARRGALLHALLGSVAKRIVTALPCDALVVPDSRTEDSQSE